jgi:hypothetical protein
MMKDENYVNVITRNSLSFKKISNFDTINAIVNLSFLMLNK